ncbi:cell division protein FtsQ/DivIB [Streptomyces palmae]|uniref:Cell division protein FtsQ n=1 Tax=Streptomyces palmae TaxID=1701085 RepID=A0A4Z0HBD3_9ACTN|nr:FtsQ-type POTRA domain-containing protein [Streptomyces palmae]TGB16391.1 FtsQ-type POTRA domain-containing protein [Streptomyces palmae]
MAGPTTARRGDRRTPRTGARGGGSDGRARRLRQRLPRRRTLLLLLLATALLTGGGTWVLYGSDWLRAERVKVSGTEVLTPEEVRRVADVPLGSPMASVDTGSIERRLRAGLPRIDQVRVSRSWPHTIRVEVDERHPRAVLRSGGRYVEVDRSGVRFATVAERPKGVPVLDLDLGKSSSSRRFGVDRLRREGVRVAAALPASVRRSTQVVRVRSYDSITLELTRDRTVMWGSGESGAAKARSLLALLKAAPEAAHFDVSAPGAPAVAGS